MGLFSGQLFVEFWSVGNDMRVMLLRPGSPHALMQLVLMTTVANMQTSSDLKLLWFKAP